MNDINPASEGVATTGFFRGIFSNPVLLRGLLAAGAALLSSYKSKDPGKLGFLGKADFSSIISSLPQILPILMKMVSGNASGEEKHDGALAASSGAVDNDSLSDVSTSGGDDLNNDDILAAFAPSKGTEESHTEGRSVQLSALPEAQPTMSIFDGHNRDERQLRRDKLIEAIKPYLSPSRQAAADTMIQVSRIADLFGGSS